MIKLDQGRSFRELKTKFLRLSRGMREEDFLDYKIT